MKQLSTISNLGAIVLCGGASTRMGTAKSQLMLNGQTFLERVCGCVGKVAAKIVVATGKQSLPTEIADVMSVCDRCTDKGPLEGIRVGLQTLRPEVEYAFVTGCDVPLLRPELIRGLYGYCAGSDAVVPFSGDRLFGLTAIYRTDLTDRLRDLIDSNRLRVVDFVNGLEATRIDVDELRQFDPQLDSLTNVNRPEQYRSLLTRCQANGWDESNSSNTDRRPESDGEF